LLHNFFQKIPLSPNQLIASPPQGGTPHTL